ncbi:MAG: putative PEP-binding protein [Anaerococcus obesiensis]
MTDFFSFGTNDLTQMTLVFQEMTLVNSWIFT